MNYDAEDIESYPHHSGMRICWQHPSTYFLGALPNPTQGFEIFAVYQQGKYVLMAGLTKAGVVFTLIFDLLLGLSRKSVFKNR